MGGVDPRVSVMSSAVGVWCEANLGMKDYIRILLENREGSSMGAK